MPFEDLCLSFYPPTIQSSNKLYHYNGSVTADELGLFPGYQGGEEISIIPLASKVTMQAKICGVEAWMLMHTTHYSRSYVILLGNDYQW